MRAVTIGMVPITSAVMPIFTPSATLRYTPPNCSASDSAPTTALCQAARPRGHADALSARIVQIRPAHAKRSVSSVNGAPCVRAILAAG